jgi:NTE family protein
MFCLIFSGGAARGLACIGVYKYFVENRLPVKAISGNSAGSIVGAFIAAGYTPEQMVEITKNTKPFKVFRPSVPPKVSLFSPKPIKEFLKTYLPERFEDLKIPLFVSATELSTGRNAIFSEGNLIDAVMASAALPPFFPPIEINGKPYNDGVFTNDLPVEPFLNKNCKRVCVDLTPLRENYKPKNAMEITLRSFLIAVRHHKVEKFKFCDYVIQPNFKGLDFVNYLKVEEFVKAGYKATKSILG